MATIKAEPEEETNLKRPHGLVDMNYDSDEDIKEVKPKIESKLSVFYIYKLLFICFYLIFYEVYKSSLDLMGVFNEILGALC